MPSRARSVTVRKTTTKGNKNKQVTTTTTRPSKARGQSSARSRAPRVRTIQAVNNAFTREPPFSGPTGGTEGANFIQCALNPFAASGSNGIPDGTQIKRIVQDHRFYADITIGSTGGCIIKTLPAMPITAVCKTTATDSTFKVNGVTPDTTQSYPGVYTHSWVPLLWPTSMTSYIQTNPAGTAGSPLEVVPPFNAVQARIVTQAFQVRYTGAANTAQGLIVVQRDQFALQKSANINRTGLVINNVYGGTQVTYAADTVLEQRFDAANSTTEYKPDSVEMRPENTPVINIKRVSGSYKWMECSMSPITLRDSSATTTYIGGSTTLFGTLYFIDPSWESVDIIITGAAAGTTFRVTCAQCMEYEPMNNSVMYSIASPAPPMDEAALVAVDNAKKASPIATTPTVSQKFVNYARRVWAGIWSRSGANPNNFGAMYDAFQKMGIGYRSGGIPGLAAGAGLSMLTYRKGN